MSGKSKRRKWTSSDKLRIVLSGLDGSIEISELCRREGINPTQYYGWKKQLTGDPNRFSTLGELVYEIYHCIFIYNTSRIHTALKMLPQSFFLRYATTQFLLPSNAS
jgi:hypothetical protein